MKMFLHVISTPFTQIGLILVVPVQGKRDRFSFFSCHINVGTPVCVSWLPKARKPPPTMVALLHVAIHAAGVVFSGHNDVGIRWVHGPSSNWRVSRRTRVFLYDYMIQQLNDSPVYFLRLPCSTSCMRRRLIFVACLRWWSPNALVIA